MASTKKARTRTTGTTKKKATHSKAARANAPTKKWSKRVNETSDALDLKPSVFKRSASEIAASLKRSAERSGRRKSTPYQSAMSMLTFYANRGGRNLSATAKRKLERAKDELRSLFGRPE